jgi:hypothetical protein
MALHADDKHTHGNTAREKMPRMGAAAVIHCMLLSSLGPCNQLHLIRSCDFKIQGALTTQAGMESLGHVSEKAGAAVVMKNCCSLRAADAVARNIILVPIELTPISPMIRCDQTHRAASSISNCTSDLFATGGSDVAVKLREATRDIFTTPNVQELK